MRSAPRSSRRPTARARRRRIADRVRARARSLRARGRMSGRACPNSYRRSSTGSHLLVGRRDSPRAAAVTPDVLVTSSRASPSSRAHALLGSPTEILHATSNTPLPTAPHHAAPEPLRQLLDERFIELGLDLDGDDLEGFEKGDETPMWSITEEVGRLVLSPSQGVWTYLAGSLEGLDFPMRVRLVERLSRYLTYKRRASVPDGEDAEKVARVPPGRGADLR